MKYLIEIDGYKLDHRRQYPDKTEYIYSNWTARSSRVPGQDAVVFFGLQYFLQKYLMDDMELFFKGNIDEIASRYTMRVNSYLGPNSIGDKHIRDLHKLGYIPLKFDALPEGTCVPLRVPMLTVENTNSDFSWLVNYFETLLSCILWMPCTSATSALRLKKLFMEYAEETGTSKDFVQWQGHDFSFRGMPGLEAAILSGMGHLTSFTGTDTIPAIDAIEQYYSGVNNGIVGGSVSATEHSVMCAGGQETEMDTFKRLLNLYPSGIVSIVSDTWDLWKVIWSTLPALKEDIMARDGKLVIRPDSGDPVKIICGYDEESSGFPGKGVVECLWDIFGGTINDKGYKELDSHIGVIYGDAINYERAEEIFKQLKAKGFSSGNIVFGVGSYTYQHVTRDTYGFAMKATWAQIDGLGVDIFKKPVTDNGDKFSAKGRLSVIKNEEGKLVLLDCATPEQEETSLLKTVWKDGKFTRRTDISEVRNLCEAQS